MKKEELIRQIQKYEPLLANAVSNMVEYIQDNYSAAYPSKVQTEAVNDYLRSVYADGDGSMSERNCEHRRIASQKSRLLLFLFWITTNLISCKMYLTI